MDMNTVALIGIVVSSAMVGIAALPWKEEQMNEVANAYICLWSKVKSLF